MLTILNDGDAVGEPPTPSELPNTPAFTQPPVQFAHAIVLFRRLEASPRPNDEPVSTHPEVDTYLVRHREDGEVTESRAYRVGQLEPHGSTVFRAQNALYMWPTMPPDVEEAIVPLTEFSCATIRSTSRNEIAEMRRGLIRRVFRVPDSVLLDRGVISILYLEPRESLVTDVTPQADYVSALHALRAEIGQAGAGAIPQRFKDLLVFPGISNAGQSHDLTVVRVAPLHNRGEHSLPRSVFDIVNTLGLVQRLEAKLNEIRDHPLMAQSPVTYLGDLLRISPARLPLFRSSEDRRLAAAYVKHLANRLQKIGAQDSTRALTSSYNTLRRMFKSNDDQQDDDWLWRSETFSQSPYRFGMVVSLWGRLVSAGDEIEQVADHLDVRDEAVRDFVRDHLNAAVARSNLELQRSVRWLAVIAVLIALLSLALQLAAK